MTKIVIFEDDNVLRQSLKLLLDSIEGYCVSGDFDNCNEACAVVKTLTPDLVIMDIDMPGKTGIEGVRLIKECRPDTLVVMHTVFEDQDKLFGCLCAGANGYMLKNTSFVNILQAIDEVIRGGAPMSPTIARKVMDSFHRTRKNDYALSPREIEILTCMAKGYSYKMIAAECFISPETVRVHTKNIYNKLHVNCGREAVAIALRNRIIA